MLSQNSYLPQAKRLAPGQSARVDHDCGAGKTLTIKHDERGITAFCFRCNDHGWQPPAQVPLAERLKRLAKSQAADNKASVSVELPTPAVHAWAEWPAASRLWLLKAGLCSADLPRLGAYYHPPTDRVVLPVSDPLLGTLFWQARATDGRAPKYLAPPVNKASVIPKYGRSEVVTLTEDILSAYKVGKVGEGWSLLGTSASKCLIAEILVRGCAVNLWLDSDKAGRRAATKTAARLRSVGVEVKDICTNKDPKLIHLGEIKELV